jgi:hypothetical protein
VRQSYTRQLEMRWACRETEGGCGAQPGEPCKTYATGKPTYPHVDRWNQQRGSDYREEMRHRRADWRGQSVLVGVKLTEEMAAAVDVARAGTDQTRAEWIRSAVDWALGWQGTDRTGWGDWQQEARAAHRALAEIAALAADATVRPAPRANGAHRSERITPEALPPDDRQAQHHPDPA